MGGAGESLCNWAAIGASAAVRWQPAVYDLYTLARLAQGECSTGCRAVASSSSDGIDF